MLSHDPDIVNYPFLNIRLLPTFILQTIYYLPPVTHRVGYKQYINTIKKL